MKNSIIVLSLMTGCLFASSCVSKKKYAEMQTSYNRLQAENGDLKKSYQEMQVNLAECRTNSKSLDERLEEAKKAKENTPPKTEPTDTRFIIRTNLPLNTSPSKTRLQEFNEFISRINNKKHTIAIPDIPGSPEEAKPLFSQQELTFTNHAGTEVRLVTSFETKIQLVNERLKFVVLDYSFEPMPPMETRLAIYREGQKIGLVKVTGPIKNGNVIAVILEGFPQVGDTVIREVY